MSTDGYVPINDKISLLREGHPTEFTHELNASLNMRDMLWPRILDDIENGKLPFRHEYHFIPSLLFDVVSMLLCSDVSIDEVRGEVEAAVQEFKRAKM